MMKLKYININGFGLLVDKSAEIKEGDWYYDSGDINLICKAFKHTTTRYYRKKIIFADHKLNLDVPILPNWREWESKLSALQLNLAKGIDSIRPDLSSYKVYEEGFIAGYNHNKANYTEEDLRKAIYFFKTYQLATNREIFDKDISVYIQSLQKLPKYIVLESEYQDMHGMWISEPTILKELDRPTRPKLITNSEGKQEGVIKEIIW